MWQKLSKCYPPILELLPVILLGVTLYITLSNYSSIPERIPIDYNSQGIPEEWTNKNLIFLYLGLSTFLYLLITAINFWLAVTKNPKSLINIPQSWKESLSDSQTEKLRVVLNRYLFVLKVLIQGLIIYLLHASIEIAMNRMSNIGGLTLTLFIIAIIVTISLMVWRSFNIARTSPQNNI
jgi:uncharacterized membrane protein